MLRIIKLPIFVLITLFGMICLLSNCAVMIIGTGVGIATTAAIISDPRNSKIIFDDKSIFTNIHLKISRDKTYRDSNIEITVYDQVVLITGEIKDEFSFKQVEALAKMEPGVRRVYNFAEIRLPTSIISRAQDAKITSILKTRMFNMTGISSNSVKVFTSKSCIYLFGIVTAEDGKKIASLAAAVEGVEKVITLYEYIVR